MKIVSGVYGNFQEGCASITSDAVVKKLCNEKTTCTLHVSSSVFGDPCSKIKKKLYIQYQCKSFPNASRFAIQERRGRQTIRCAGEKRLKILSGVYGRGISCVSPTSDAKVKDYCNGKNWCTLSASNSVFGDPCRGIVKELVVHYTCGGAAVSNDLIRKVLERQTQTIGCAGGKRLKILSGVYGRGISCVSPTSDAIVKEKCDGKNSCTLSASNSVFGDPCRGTYKELVVHYTCGGAAGAADEVDEQTQQDIPTKFENELEDFGNLLENTLIDLREDEFGVRVRRGDRSSNNALLDKSPLYVNLGVQKANTCGTWHYMCTRNNNFSNRSQKGKVKVYCPRK